MEKHNKAEIFELIMSINFGFETPSILKDTSVRVLSIQL